MELRGLLIVRGTGGRRFLEADTSHSQSSFPTRGFQCLQGRRGLWALALGIECFAFRVSARLRHCSVIGLAVPCFAPHRKPLMQGPDNVTTCLLMLSVVLSIACSPDVCWLRSAQDSYVNPSYSAPEGKTHVGAPSSNLLKEKEKAS